MRQDPGGAMRRATNVAGWVALLALFSLGAGGAAAWPGGFLVGLPGAASAGLVLLGVGLLVALTRGAGAGPALGLILPALLLLAGARCPEWRAFSGPPLLALGMAGAVAALAHARPRVARFAFFPAVLALYAIVSARVQVQVGPRGDEPHYLMVAESLLRDHDLSLEKDYAEGATASSTTRRSSRTIASAARGARSTRSMRSAFPCSSCPRTPWAAIRRRPSSWRSWRRCWPARSGSWSADWSDRDDLAEGVGWAVALSPPLIHYAGLVFTEVPAALGVAFALERLLAANRRGAPGRGGSPGLPALAQRPLRASSPPSCWPTGSGPASHERSCRPPRSDGRLGRWPSPRTISSCMAFSTRGGSTAAGASSPSGPCPKGCRAFSSTRSSGFSSTRPCSPWPCPVFSSFGAKIGAIALVALGLVGAVVLTAGTWPMWRGGFNPPARFLVPLVPVLALAVAAALRRGLTAGAALARWAGACGSVRPGPPTRASSIAIATARLRSSAPRPGPRSGRACCPATCWPSPIAAGSRWSGPRPSLLALPWRRAIDHGRPRGRGGARVLAAAGVASIALRTAGARAVTPFAWWAGPRSPFRAGLSRSLAARWGPEPWTGAPLFEPHRHPGGRRARWPPAACPRPIRAAARGRASSAPSGPGRRGAARPAGRALASEPVRAPAPSRFDVREADGPVTLRLRGGRALPAEGGGLAPSTLTRGTGPRYRRRLDEAHVSGDAQAPWRATSVDRAVDRPRSPVRQWPPR